MIISLSLILQISSTCCINSGQIAELKHLNHVVIKKYPQNTPVFITVKSKDQQVIGELVHKLKMKPMEMKSSKSKKRFSRSILFPAPKLPIVPLALPLIPHPPLLPIFPNWLLNPTPALAINTSPLLQLSRLMDRSKRHIQIRKKLLELKRKGTLTTAQYIRFENLLLNL